MNRTRQIKRFKTKSERLIDELRELIEGELPSKGDIESDCQKLVLINRCCALEQAISGVEKSDFIKSDRGNE